MNDKNNIKLCSITCKQWILYLWAQKPEKVTNELDLRKSVEKSIALWNL